ncbi:MAG: hypothetical protein DRN99_09040, partial [Thermoproteota archaeon]
PGLAERLERSPMLADRILDVIRLRRLSEGEVVELLKARAAHFSKEKPTLGPLSEEDLWRIARASGGVPREALKQAARLLAELAAGAEEPKPPTPPPEAELGELTPFELKVLKALALGEKTSAQVAAEVGSSRGSVNNALRRLLKRRLVERRGDRRAGYRYKLPDQVRRAVLAA